MGSIAAMTAAAYEIDRINTGYNQWTRWSFYDRKTKTLIPNKEGDCSSVCGAIIDLGGYPIDLLRDDWFYTGVFRQRAIEAGFTAIPFSQVGLGGLREGDFVLSTLHHVEYMVSDKLMFSANKDENGRATGGKPGDQTGVEVYVKPKFIYSKGWDWVLRPPTNTTTPTTTAPAGQEEEEEMKTTGLVWTSKDGKPMYALVNPGSGFFSAWTTGASGTYNNPIAKGFDTGSFVKVTESHANALAASCALVRGDKQAVDVTVVGIGE